jgi:uncharacterized LabA/DUF88 family protein
MKESVIAYIDGANLDQGVKSLGWHLDYKRFRVWLKDKYKVDQAYIFIGLVSRYSYLYKKLQDAGFILVFKETVLGKDGQVKGNCDADLVLNTVVDFFENKFSKAVIVSSDGDYASLVRFLKDKDSCRVIISPNNKSSILLRRLNVPLLYLDTQKSLLQKEKAPDRDETL